MVCDGSKRPPKPPSRSSPPGASPRPPPGLIEAALLQRLTLSSPGDAGGNLLLSDNYSLVSALDSTTTGGGRLTRRGVTTHVLGSQHGESPSATPRAGVGFHSLRGGGSPAVSVRSTLSPQGGASTCAARSTASPLSRCNSPADARWNDLPQACILIDKRLSQILCLGRVGELSRFCIKSRENGYSHCGTRSHGGASKKFAAVVDCYYPPGGFVAD